MDWMPAAKNFIYPPEEKTGQSDRFYSLTPVIGDGKVGPTVKIFARVKVVGPAGLNRAAQASDQWIMSQSYSWTMCL
jgi:hypothetical protein